MAAAEAGGPSKEVLLAVVLLTGATVSMVCNPVWGAFSDRTTSRFGRRVPWVVGGAVTGAAALLVLLSWADGPVWLVLGWCLAQLALNAAWAGGTAAVPDQVPVPRRGLVGGLIAIAGTVGVLLGIKIAELTGSIAQGYLVTAVTVLVLAVPWILGSRDVPLPRDHVLAAVRRAGDAAVLLGVAARAPRLRVGLAHPAAGQPRQLDRPQLPLLLPHRRPRLRRRRRDRPSSACSSCCTAPRRCSPPWSSAGGATGSGGARSS